MAKKVLTFSRGKQIIKSGKYEKRMYVILEGEVEISFEVNAERVFLARLAKGDFFGEVSLFEDIERTANVHAITDVRLTYMDNVDDLERFLLLNPRLAVRMVKTLVRRIADTDQLLKSELSGHRVMKYMW